MNIHHKLGSAKPVEVAQTTFAALTLIQERPPEAQLMTATLLAMLLCDSYGVQLTEVMQYTNNLLADDAAMQISEFKALFAYVDKEIPKVQ